MEGPPAKRARTSSSSQVPSSQPTSLERDEEFWLEDGSIVLVCKNVGFRVYRVLLASQSTVFADMLATANPDAGETYEGCPVVRLSDSPEDMRHFLRAIVSRTTIRCVTRCCYSTVHESCPQDLRRASKVHVRPALRHHPSLTQVQRRQRAPASLRSYPDAPSHPFLRMG